MPQISLRSVFEGQPSLRPVASSFGLSFPISLRAAAAHQAIGTAYARSGGFKGQLGVATNGITSTDGRTFGQSFRGGDLTFTDDGKIDLTKGFALQVGFQGIHCFGNPGLGKNDDVYAIISIFRPEQAIVETKKLPNDGTDDVWDNLEKDESRTEGQTVLNPAPLMPPQPISISAKVMRCGALNCNTGSTKTAVESAAAAVAGAAGTALTGVAAVGAAAAAFGAAVADALSNLLGLSDTEIGTFNKTFTDLNDLQSLPKHDSKTFGEITYNLEPDEPITDNDASYKLYFNVELIETTELSGN